jgi:class 3 adenylate cyclase
MQRRLAEHRQEAGFAPQIRIGVHATDASQVGENYRGLGVHEAARIAALAKGGEIVASATTVDERFRTSNARQEALRGLSEPVEVVTVDWR